MPLRLSLNSQTIPRHSQRQNVASGLGDGLGYRFLRALLDHHQNAATTARTTDLGRAPAIFASDRNQLVDEWGRDPGSISAAQLPLLAEQARNVLPVVTKQSLVHVARDGCDLFQIPKHMLVAVDMRLEDFPIVDTGLAWCAGVSQYKAQFDLLGRNRDSRAPNSVRRQMALTPP